VIIKKEEEKFLKDRENIENIENNNIFWLILNI
jgi:hypothetical protein